MMVDHTAARAPLAGAATLTVALWLTAVWILDTIPASVRPWALGSLVVVAVAAVYLAGRAHGRIEGACVAFVLLALSALWLWSSWGALVGAVLVLVIGIGTIRPALVEGSRGVAAFLLTAQLAALATIALLTLSDPAAPVRLSWVGGTWMIFGLAMIAAAARASMQRSGVLPSWPLVALAGLLISAQVGVQAYGAWRPWPPDAPVRLMTVSGVLALLAMLALSAAEMRAGRQKP